MYKIENNFEFKKRSIRKLIEIFYSDNLTLIEKWYNTKNMFFTYGKQHCTPNEYIELGFIDEVLNHVKNCVE